MLGDITRADNIYVVTGYTDMRRSVDGLLAIVMDHLHMTPDLTLGSPYPDRDPPRA